MHAACLALPRADLPRRGWRAATRPAQTRTWRSVLLSALVHAVLLAIAVHVGTPASGRPNQTASGADDAGPAILVAAADERLPDDADLEPSLEPFEPEDLPVPDPQEARAPADPVAFDPLPEPGELAALDEEPAMPLDPVADIAQLLAPTRAIRRAPLSRPAPVTAPSTPVSIALAPASRAVAPTPRTPSPSASADLSPGVLVPPSPWPSNRQPSYPAEALALRAGGVVLLTLVVSSEGLVTSVRVERSSGAPSLDRAAAEVAASWRFHPATRDGRPIAAIVHRAVRFAVPDAP